MCELRFTDVAGRDGASHKTNLKGCEMINGAGKQKKTKFWYTNLYSYFDISQLFYILIK